jgi:hypothetical protein
MRGELLHGPVGLGLVAVRPGDQRSRLVRHEQQRHAVDELQRADDRSEPVVHRLARGGAGVGVVRGAEHSDEDLRGRDLAGARVDDRHGLPGVVDEQPLTCDVGLSHRARQRCRPRPVFDAETRVLVGEVVAAGVLLPQQLQGHARALELLVDVGVVRLKLGARTRYRRPVQAPLQLGIVELLGQRPVDTGAASHRHDAADRALGHLQRTAALAVAQPRLQVQAQDFSDLTHRDPRCGHGSAKKASSVCLPKDHLRAPGPSTIRLKCRPRSA